MRIRHSLESLDLGLAACLAAAALASVLLGAGDAAPKLVPGRVHHLNGATLHPLGKWAVEGAGWLFERGTLLCHMLLVETDGGLVLVETALGTRDLAEPATRLPAFWQWLTRPSLDPAEPAVRQIERLGFRPAEVTDIVLTHLDLDHDGGLADFPTARVHVSALELEVAQRSTAGRYRKTHWAHQPRWVTHRPRDRWFDFSSAKVVSDPEIRLVSLPGHSAGHCGVAVATGASWLLHAGDAYFHRSELRGEPERECPVGLEAFQSIAQTDRRTRLGTQDRLRALTRAHSEVRVFCSHDPVELAELQ